MHDTKTLEMVTFTLNEGVTEAEFLATVDGASAWVKTQTGFLSRDLVRRDDGKGWIEVVWWNSLEQAKAAAEAAETSESCAPMFSKIVFEDIVMLHGETAIPHVSN